jgi:hypothetical protein
MAIPAGANIDAELIKLDISAATTGDPPRILLRVILRPFTLLRVPVRVLTRPFNIISTC